MKFGYRDRIVLLIACVVIIFGIGIVLFIKPKYESLKKDKKARDEAKKEWAIQLEKFDGIPGRQDKLNADFETAKGESKKFVDSMDAIDLDNFLREKFMNTEEHIEHGMRLDGGLSVSDAGTASLNYYYYTPSVVTYPLYELADMDGSLAKAAADKRHESDVLSTRAAQTVGAGDATFALKVNRKDAMALIDAVHDYAVKNKDAMILHSVTFSDYKFLGGLELDEDGNVKKDDTAQTANPDETTPGTTEGEEEEDLGGTATMTVSYSVYYMQEPTKPDVGPSYDPSVWETDAWRTYSQAE